MITSSFFSPGDSSPSPTQNSPYYPISSFSQGSANNNQNFFNPFNTNGINFNGTDQTNTGFNNWLLMLCSGLSNQGNQGFQGYQGFQGNQGFQGYQGFQGNQGMSNYGYYSNGYPSTIYGLGTFAYNPYFMQNQGGQGGRQGGQGGRQNGQGRGRQNGRWQNNQGWNNQENRGNAGSNYDYYGFGSAITFNQPNYGRRPFNGGNGMQNSNGFPPSYYNFG